MVLYVCACGFYLDREDVENQAVENVCVNEVVAFADHSCEVLDALTFAR